MSTLRRWKLDSAQPYALQLAADARLGPTDYHDDQVWELRLGAGSETALALQTRYGGRAGLASLVPLWTHDGRMIYQTLAYAKPPLVTAFAPGYAVAEGELLPRLALRAEYRVMDSHAVGGRFTLKNATRRALTLRFDLFGHVGINNQEQKLGIVTYEGGSNALSLGEIGDIHPVVVVEGGRAAAGGTPKTGVDLTIDAGDSAAVRWVHAGLPALRDSLALALGWLRQDWTPQVERIERAAAAIPAIETGDAALDALLAFSYQHLVQSFLAPTANLPYASFVGTRHPGTGVNMHSHRAWSGQQVQHAYLLAAALATVDPEMSAGVLRNYLAVQSADGFVDSKPGLDGQREGTLCAPLLARLALALFQATEDEAFRAEVVPALHSFYQRWFARDVDADGDGFPEWAHERQTGYVYFPTFGATQNWAQGADVRAVESPDLAALLLSEAAALEALGGAKVNTKALEKALESTWDAEAGRYCYRDRDTHVTGAGAGVVEAAQGDAELLPSYTLSPAGRLIVEITGGLGSAPGVTLTLTGYTAGGEPVTEVATRESFVWKTGRGVYTSRTVFGQLDRVRADGLSRVYRVSVRALDTTRLDVNALLPLASRRLKKARVGALVKLLNTQFLSANGISMCARSDARFDPANADGSGGVFGFWNALLCEGLLDSGQGRLAVDVLKRLLAAQTRVLRAEKAFFEFYHADEPQGLGERGHSAGIAPLHVVMRVLGVRVTSPGRVWTGGAYLWGTPVTVRQHGVVVTRRKSGTSVTFPGGHTVTLDRDAPWQAVTDPTYTPAPAAPEPEPQAPAPLPAPAAPTQPDTTIIIEVQRDDQ